MKVPLRFQNTEYDCGTTTYINALAYLFNREEIPIQLIKKIYKYTLDIEGESGVIGEGGTSTKATEKLTHYISNYANEHDFNIKCTILEKDSVTLCKIKQCTDNDGVVIARCYMEEEHYILITKISNDFAYIFDPYYLPEEYYTNDKDVSVVLYNDFTHNRLVTIDRLMGQSKKDFSLMEINKREAILINKIN